MEHTRILQQMLEEVEHRLEMHEYLLVNVTEELFAQQQVDKEEKQYLRGELDRIKAGQHTISNQQALEEANQMRSLIKERDLIQRQRDELHAACKQSLERLEWERKNKHHFQEEVDWAGASCSYSNPSPGSDFSTSKHSFELQLAVDEANEQKDDLQKVCQELQEALTDNYEMFYGEKQLYKEENLRLQAELDRIKGTSEQVVILQRALEEENKQRALLQNRYDELHAEYTEYKEEQQQQRQKDEEDLKVKLKMLRKAVKKELNRQPLPTSSAGNNQQPSSQQEGPSRADWGWGQSGGEKELSRNNNGFFFYWKVKKKSCKRNPD